MLLVRLVCALGAHRRYALAGIASAAVYLVAARGLVPAMGAEGLALASAVGSACLCLFLAVGAFTLLRRGTAASP
jgi:hypothetical protein